MLAQCVQDGLVPGAAAAVGTAEGTLHQAKYGCAQLTPERRPLREDALFDLASVTKIVATTTLALRYLEQGKLHLDQRAAAVLPPFGALGKQNVTVRRLLTHTSGLPSPVSGWRERFFRGEWHPPIWDLICRQPLRWTPGSTVFYSDIGFFTLGLLLAEVGGAPLDELVRREVFEPLGMSDTQFCPPAAVRDRVAATEVVPTRGGAVAGAVHDEMAASAGGVCGHAGLFSTCADLARFCRAWLGTGRLDGQRFLSAASVAAATRDQTGGAVDRDGFPARRGLGWVLQPNPRWVGADLCSPVAYSHTGFTGTSLLIDPAAGIFAVLLTNRVHPTRHGGSAGRITSLRTRFHNAVWAALAPQRAALAQTR